MTPGAPAARAVIDPGVFISALLSSRGAPEELVGALEAGSFESVVSTALIGELERVLRRPKFANKIHDEDITPVRRVRPRCVDTARRPAAKDGPGPRSR